jgi:hypothetical protein
VPASLGCVSSKPSQRSCSDSSQQRQNDHDHQYKPETATRKRLVRKHGPGVSVSVSVLTSTDLCQRQLPAHGVQRLGADDGSSLYRFRACRGGHSSGRRWFDRSLHCRLCDKRDPRWRELPVTLWHSKPRQRLPRALLSACFNSFVVSRNNYSDRTQFLKLKLPEIFLCGNLAPHRLDSTRIALSVGAFGALGEGQEFQSTGGETRSRRGLGSLRQLHSGTNFPAAVF